MLSNRFWRFLVRNWPFAKGRTRLYRAAWSRLAGREIFPDAFGCRYVLDLDQFIDAHVALDGGFETESIRALLGLIRARGCARFIDVGANIGLYTVPIAREAAVRQVHAFEPDPAIFARLHANIELNACAAKIDARRLALSNASGEAEFHVSAARKDIDWGKLNLGTSSLSPNPARHTDSFKVEVRGLDEILQVSGEKIAIKIDVEGHELAALEGMSALLRNNDCVLQLEIFPQNFERTDLFLRLLGYAPMSDSPSEGENHIYARLG